MMAKYFTSAEREQIEIGVSKGKSISAIAKELGKHRTTVSREIRNYSTIDNKGAPYRPKNKCLNRKHC